jgi:hypothetical protein
VSNITPEEQQAIMDWKSKDQQAYAAISLRISDDYLIYTSGLLTAFDVWQTLSNIFEAKGPITIINKCQEFFQTFAEENTDMEAHVWKMRTLQ